MALSGVCDPLSPKPAASVESPSSPEVTAVKVAVPEGSLGQVPQLLPLAHLPFLITHLVQYSSEEEEEKSDFLDLLSILKSSCLFDFLSDSVHF